jgi:hypothetical protein
MGSGGIVENTREQERGSLLPTSMKLIACTELEFYDFSRDDALSM